jgi:hypothetical protein
VKFEGFRWGTPRNAYLDGEVMVIRLVQLLEEGASIFVEMPEMKPTTQLYLRMHLKGADRLGHREACSEVGQSRSKRMARMGFME